MDHSHRLLRALFRQPVDCTPIWIMRQAGRYLPEYQAARQRAGSFLNLCKTPELACEVSLQPINRFPLDAAIIFSDILTIPDAMGLGLHFIEGEGPKFNLPIRSPRDIEKLGIPDMAMDLSYVTDAIQLVVKELQGKIPLIGFSGSPWTLATYMVEGGASKEFNYIRKFLYQEPEAIHQLLALLADAVTQYLHAQVLAGAQVLMLFDTYGGLLTPIRYQIFSLHYMKKIISDLKKINLLANVPIILFTKGGGQWLETIADSGCEAIGVDWMTDIGDARRRVGHKVALQGNLDPAVLLSSPKIIHQETTHIMKSFGEGNGHIFNLGHGISQHVPPEHVEALIDSVHSFKL